MKVIDLLNKIANGEDVPKEINYEGVSYTYDDYITDYKRTVGKDLFTYLFTENRTETFLNDEVEVIEEDKKIPTLKNLNLTRVDINKKGQVYGVTTREIVADIQTLQNWINEIIGKINEME